MVGNTESDLILQEYIKNPVNNFIMDKYDIKYEEWNSICDDNVVVYLKIKWNRVSEFSFFWDCSMVCIASSSIIAEHISWCSFDEILSWDYSFLSSRWLELSVRRKNTAVLPIVSIQNWILRFLNKKNRVYIDDLL